MIEKKCLYCQKDFVAKKETKKYCSESCKVMFNRKNVVKDAIKPLQVQVLYNAMLEMLQNGGNVPTQNTEMPLPNKNSNKVSISSQIPEKIKKTTVAIKIQNKAEFRPRMEGESGLDYSIAKRDFLNNKNK